ncbi:MAG: ribulose-phosphate 3-epimerase [Candidatus Limnocylindrus sp.]
MTRTVQIAASILNADLGALREAVQEAERAGVDRIHLDIMDGHFVPNLTFGIATVEALRGATSLPFDAHLMIGNPSLWAPRYAAAGCQTVAIHIEVPEQHQRTLDSIRASGAHAGLAADPGTPASAIAAFHEHLDFALVMTVKSGFGGQSYQPDAAARIREIRAAIGADRLIHVDGGIRAGTAADAVAKGADILVAGTALFGAEDMRLAVEGLRPKA